jgi:hypothetical protein
MPSPPSPDIAAVAGPFFTTQMSGWGFWDLGEPSAGFGRTRNDGIFGPMNMNCFV